MIRRFFATFFEIPNAAIEPLCQPSELTFKSTSLESLNWLFSAAPAFPIHGSKVTVLYQPSLFYETLVSRCLAAKKRIVLTSLYLGTGALEKHLISAINDNVRANKELKVNILLDFTRGTRGEENSKTSLLPLLETSGNCVLSLYHTPVLRGITKRLAPPRWNELLGLQHMKIYLFDDTVILSGANLSNDYFTNRQDRYIMIEDKSLADFYHSFVAKVQEFSFQVDAKGNEHLHNEWQLSPYEAPHRDFVREARQRISSFFKETIERQKEAAEATPDADTWIFPTVEMGQLDIHHDSVAVRRLMSSTLPGGRLKMATGYFNLTQSFMDTITNECKAHCSILMAHPNANGFQGAKGPAGGIPAAYSLLAQRFYDALAAAGQEQRVQMHEYEQPGWTYHAKGLWYYLPESKLPDMTVIGSSNFGERSVQRDLETQICLVTKNKELRQQLQLETEHLYRFAKTAEDELIGRPIPRWVKTVVWLFKNFF